MITCKVTKAGIALLLGRQGENLAREMVFDISGWVSEFGDGTAVLLVKRPEDSTTYPASVSLEDGTVTWPVTSTDTAQAGKGKCELQYLVGDVVVKSHTWQTVVTASLEAAGDVPDPETGWVAELLAAVDARIAACLEEHPTATEPSVYDLKELGIASVPLAGGATSASTDTAALVAALQSGPVTFALNLSAGSTVIPITMTGYAASGNFSGTEAYELTQVFYYNTTVLISVVVYATGTIQVITSQLA